jgi:hypothetical protein
MGCSNPLRQIIAATTSIVIGCCACRGTPVCVYPFVAVVSQIAEYRRVSSLLELLDVLEREGRASESGDQQAKT